MWLLGWFCFFGVAFWFFSLKHRVCEPPKEFTYSLKGTIVFLDIVPTGHFSLLTRTSWKVLCTKWCPCCLLLPFWQVPLRESLDLNSMGSVLSLLTCIFKNKLSTDLSRAGTTVLCSEIKCNCTCFAGCKIWPHSSRIKNYCICV